MVISQRHIDPPTAIVWAQGEIDIATAPELRLVLAEVIDGGCVRVTVDLAEVTFMAAAGIHTLLRARAEAEARSGWLNVVNPSPMVVRVVAAARAQELLAMTLKPHAADAGPVRRPSALTGSGSAREQV